MDAVEQVWQQIESVPKVKCVQCEREKAPCLFSPSQLKRTNPRCRMCCYKPKAGAGNGQ